MDMEGSGYGLIKVVCQYLIGRIEGNHESPRNISFSSMRLCRVSRMEIKTVHRI
jgi:hypothetical protein